MIAYDTRSSTGPSSNRVDIVFAGDGYQSSEIETIYSGHVDALTSYMFSGDSLSQPFGRYKNFLNVHQVNVVSAESGADDPSTNTFRNTALDASYLWDGVTQRLLYADTSKADAVIAHALSGTGIDPDIRFVAVNDAQYGGGGGAYAVYAGGNPASLEVALHEVGHSFAGLADEYSESATRYEGPEPDLPNVTTDPTGAKWAQWLGYDQPGIGLIGAYEGGLYQDYGIYRPSLDSKMRSLGQPFDAVGREQFILKIYDYVDPIDTHSDNSAPLVNTDSIFVDVVDPTVIKVRWSVGGKLVKDGGVYDFDLSDQGFGIGRFTVTALAYDDTDWVRVNRDKLQESVTWTIDVPTGATGCADYLTGTKKIDHIFGLAGNDRIFGFGGDDTLSGNAGKDWLDGGSGDDVLIGGKDQDIFVFGTEPGKNNIDDLRDFSVADDTIWLDHDIFPELSKRGSEQSPAKLKKQYFTIGEGAKGKHDHLIYDDKAGILYYDADGLGKDEAMAITTLPKNLDVTNKDIFIV